MSIDLSLDRLNILITHLPPYTRPTLHIAGTNGKGSVSALVSSILSSSSLTVGRYNSPHLLSPLDSISLSTHPGPVPLALYTAAREEVEAKDAEHGTRLSSFELLTLTALRVFEMEKVDVVVLEVGMGGRLDATNVVPDGTILVSALTAVDLDHQAFLGGTVGEIAREKAGIARRGRTVVLGRQGHGEEVVGAVKEVVSAAGAVLVSAIGVEKREWDESVDGPRPAPFSLLTSSSDIRPPPQPIRALLPCFPDPLHALLPLHGAHQLDNASTALTVISTLLTDPTCQEIFDSTRRTSLKECITAESIARGVRETEWPGRLSFHRLALEGEQAMQVLADGAHNPASAATLGAYITHLLSIPSASKIHITYILSLSHSPPKTPLQTLTPLLPPTSSADVQITTSVALLRFSPPEGMPWVKCVPPTELAGVVRSLVPNAEVWVAPEEQHDGALEKALRWAGTQGLGGEDGRLVVLAGSLYLVADFYRLLESLGQR
ncbi:Mur ligase [Crassisporium funariophilum]|nr:Mur ligase [Crassisporium funariophilum]